MRKVTKTISHYRNFRPAKFGLLTSARSGFQAYPTNLHSEHHSLNLRIVNAGHFHAYGRTNVRGVTNHEFFVI